MLSPSRARFGLNAESNSVDAILLGEELVLIRGSQDTRESTRGGV